MGYLRLARPANVVTAVSDILAGVVIAGSLDSIMSLSKAPFSTTLLSGSPFIYAIVFLILSTACLYGGGVVMNDVFDAELDKVERPERPIPSGLIPKGAATAFGLILLLAGIVFAALSNALDTFSISFWLAVAIAVASLVYDKWGKHNRLIGPLNMGLCRALNLLLGMSLIGYAVWVYWILAIMPMIYIAAITMISRGEVHGSKKNTLYLAAALYLAVIAMILYFSYLNITFLSTLPFAAIFSVLIFPPLQRAISKPEGPRIGKAVKSGVIALIAMNACWAAAFGDVYFAIIILLLLPLSLFLARLFAVT